MTLKGKVIDWFIDCSLTEQYFSHIHEENVSDCCWKIANFTLNKLHFKDDADVVFVLD